MTDREKAIVMAYTGIAMFEGEKINEYYKYLKELYGRPVYTHEIVTLDIAEKAKPDFIRLCEETPDKRTETHERVLIDKAEAIKAIDTIGFDFSDCELSAVELEELEEVAVEVRDAMIDRVRHMTAADVVSREVVNQIKWERDTAIQQLNELGYEFGERRKDDN